MSEENTTAPEFDYQQPKVDAAAEQLQEMQSGNTASPDDMNAVKEREAFKTYVETSNVERPENFQDNEAWFNSLKEAQKNYTQGQQENAALRKQMAEQNAQQPVAETPEVAPPVEEVTDSELRIPDAPPEPEAVPTPEGLGINQEDWKQWGYEIATTGSLMEETVSEIQTKTGLSKEMITDFVAGQKAKMRESFATSAQVVGGKENLEGMLKWASENLTEQERYAINHGFSDASLRETTLRGLNSRYQEALGNKPIAKEPPKIANKINVSQTRETLTGYKTMREFKQDRSDPRFSYEPEFRAAVEERMMKTDFNYIPE